MSNKSSNILYTPGAAKDPDNVLRQAIGQTQDVIVIGWDIEGELFAAASLDLNHANVLWLLEQFKRKLVDGDYADDEHS